MNKQEQYNDWLNDNMKALKNDFIEINDIAFREFCLQQYNSRDD